MAIEIFPTANDIGGSGTGRTATEENMVQTLDRFSSPSSILLGMVPSAGTGLAVDVAAGRCQIDGYLVRFTATEAVTVTASKTDYYLWLQLTGAGDSPPAVTASTWVETADLTSPPANAALVGKFTTSGSAVTDIEDNERREGCGFVTGSYTGDASSALSIDLGLTPSYVHVSHPSVDPNYSEDLQAGDRGIARSKIWPGNAAFPTLNVASYNVSIVKDGFVVYGASDWNAAAVYPYIAWF